MLGYEIRRNTRKAWPSILRIFSDNTFNFNKKIFVRDNYSATFTSNFNSADRNCIYVQGIMKNFKHLPSVYKCLRFLNKSQVRRYSDSSNQSSNGLPNLTSLPLQIWPSFLSPFSNLLITYLVIKPHVDKSFGIKEFLNASTQVVRIVSNKLADGDIEGLSEMVTSDVLREIQQNLPKFSVGQRQELIVEPDDIYFATPTSIMLNNDRNADRKYLEITLVYHSVKGLKDATRSAENINPFNMQNMKEQLQSGQNAFQELSKLNDDKSYILNYRFIREYSSDSAGDWLLSGVNHYKKTQIMGLRF